ncbi:hypothetical protein [Leuconostoc pseudomesenteroides]|uniref:hypothetical protein n=1 Tax=Leuconostoc pseudomesenteroides TaxID=33968 RepID=UPI0022866C88|nr:hypothetical protein [Leuconostoc pseudomesenteroides]WAM37863.1 hypothetical protein OYT93_06550 [Leuconostoc pseudomesenteroides]
MINSATTFGNDGFFSTMAAFSKSISATNALIMNVSMPIKLPSAVNTIGRIAQSLPDYGKYYSEAFSEATLNISKVLSGFSHSYDYVKFIDGITTVNTRMSNLYISAILKSNNFSSILSGYNSALVDISTYLKDIGAHEETNEISPTYELFPFDESSFKEKFKSYQLNSTNRTVEQESKKFKLSQENFLKLLIFVVVSVKNELLSQIFWNPVVSFCLNDVQHIIILICSWLN